MPDRLSVTFTAPGRVSIISEHLSPPVHGQVQVRSLISAISSGTEMLILRGQAPQDIPLDETILSLPRESTFPLKYGYSLVGQVTELSKGVDSKWEDQLVFAFHPHESAFNIHPDALLPLPEGIPPQDAIFLPNMETAVNFVMDGKPIIGEQVVVFGQGIVGLLTTALLAQYPLKKLVTLDYFIKKRMESKSLGAGVCLDPSAPDVISNIKSELGANMLAEGADLVFEISGSPAALEQAIAVCGYSGRIIVGSWYGKKHAELNLGGRFHRGRIHLVSSQVSSLAPEFLGRWTKSRRLDVAWEAIRAIKPARLISHRFPIQEAANAYELLALKPDETIQVVLTH